jgi:hypothetical protein
MTARPAIAPDIFAPIAGPADDVLAGLTRLADGPPLWGSKAEWAELVAGLRAFEDRWGGPARRARWSLGEISFRFLVRLSRFSPIPTACKPL